MCNARANRVNRRRKKIVARRAHDDRSLQFTSLLCNLCVQCINSQRGGGDENTTIANRMVSSLSSR